MRTAFHNSSGNTEADHLVLAVKANKPRVVRTLMRHGASVNKVVTVWESQPMSLLAFAQARGYYQVAAELRVAQDD